MVNSNKLSRKGKTENKESMIHGNYVHSLNYKNVMSSKLSIVSKGLSNIFKRHFP